jgi:glycosyltransferase involved in cell wall biosynthesis
VDDFDVDVLIPVRNGARFLQACLDSVFAQSSSVRAVIVVDDGSTDETPGVLERYAARWPNLQAIRTEPRGLPHARNRALYAAEAPFVAFLDGDDIWRPDKLAKQMALFQSARPDVGFVHCSYFCIDEQGRRLPQRWVIEPRKRGDVFTELLQGNVISGSASAVVARRGLVATAGGFDESLRHAEDWDLWLRLAKLSQIDFVPEALTGIRIHSGSLQHKAARDSEEVFLLERLRIIDKWISQSTDSAGLVEKWQVDAIRVAISNALQIPPRWGLYRRLRASDVALARNLFPDRRTYFRLLGKAVASAAERRAHDLLTGDVRY